MLFIRSYELTFQSTHYFKDLKFFSTYLFYLKPVKKDDHESDRTDF